MTGNTFFLDWEVALSEWLQKTLGAGGISLFSGISVLGEELFIVMFIGILYWGYDKQIGRRLCENVLAVCVWGPMIKNVFLRRRPYLDHESIKNYRSVDQSADLTNIQAQGFSFPSMHSANAVALFSGFAMFVRKNWARMMAIIIPLLVGISRVVVGVHYPTDVLAGWALGLVAVFILDMLTKHVPKLWVRYAILLLTAAPGLFYCKSTDYFTGMGLMIGFFGAVLFERRYVNFENTRKPMWFILRIVCGFALFVLLSSLLKLPFSKEFLDGGSMASLYVRTLRYAVTSFIVFGIYPLVFKAEKKA